MDEGQITRVRVGPKDFFLYLAAMVSLYMSVGSLLALLFGIINTAFPDPINSPYYYGGFYSSGIQFAIATLIIIFPVYLILSWILRKEITRNVAKAELWIRKWFIFVTLFLAGGAIIGDLIAVVNQFLNGEISTRFILKVLAVLVVAAGVFGYYFYDLRRTARGDQKMKPMLVVVAALVVLASIIGGFMVGGTPGEQRKLRLDQERTSDLQSIQYQITNYYQSKGTLPASTEDLNDPLLGFMLPADPETEAQYEYKKMGNLSFELCATFSGKSTVEGRSTIPVDYYGYGEGVKGASWEHEKGRECFSRTIDPSFFPLNPGVKPTPL